MKLQRFRPADGETRGMLDSDEFLRALPTAAGLGQKPRVSRPERQRGALGIDGPGDQNQATAAAQ